MSLTTEQKQRVQTIYNGAKTFGNELAQERYDRNMTDDEVSTLKTEIIPVIKLELVSGLEEFLSTEQGNNTLIELGSSI